MLALSKLLSLLDARGRVQMLFLLALSVASALLEMAGVTSTLPFMTLASNPQLLEQPGRLQQIYVWLGSPGLSSFLLGLGALVLGALTLSNLLIALSLWLGYRFSHEQQQRLSQRLFQTYLSQTYQWHIGNNHLGLGYNLGQARGLVDSNFRPFLLLLSRICSVILVSLTLAYFNPMATLVGLCVLGTAYGGAYLTCRRQLLAASLREWHLALEMGRTASEPLGGIKHVKLSGTEGDYQQLYTAQLQEFGQLQRIKLVATEVPRLVMHTLTYGAVLAFVLYLVLRYGGGTQLVGQASLWALAGYRLIPGVQQIFASLAQLESGRPALERLHEALQLKPIPGESDSQLPPLPVHHSIELRQVTFAYGQEKLFENLDLPIAARSCVGLLGSTGGGKTTLVNLLVGLLHPQQGSLCVDGKALSADEIRRFGRNIGYVPQDIYLSDDSILNNIGWGEKQVDEAAALRAASMAQLDEFVLELPKGYQTMVGERGIRLSGGQRQRVGIARALYRDPEFLVLDEATSALDSHTESQVLEAIRSLMGEKTILMVAHRLTTLEACDAVFQVGPAGSVTRRSPPAKSEAAEPVSGDLAKAL